MEQTTTPNDEYKWLYEILGNYGAHVHEAGETGKPSRMTTTDAQQQIIHEIERVKLESYRQGAIDGWEKSAEGYNGEYSYPDVSSEQIADELLKEHK